MGSEMRLGDLNVMRLDGATGSKVDVQRQKY